MTSSNTLRMSSIFSAFRCSKRTPSRHAGAAAFTDDARIPRVAAVASSNKALVPPLKSLHVPFAWYSVICMWAKKGRGEGDVVGIGADVGLRVGALTGVGGGVGVSVGGKAI